jgi:hypothetical protein
MSKVSSVFRKIELLEPVLGLVDVVASVGSWIHSDQSGGFSLSESVSMLT